MNSTIRLAILGSLISVLTSIWSQLPGDGAQASAENKCKKKIVAIGRPNRIETIANLNAVGAWISQAQKHGKKYSQWLSAEKASVECDKRGSSQFYLCRASAKPCQSG